MTATIKRIKVNPLRSAPALEDHFVQMLTIRERLCLDLLNALRNGDPLQRRAAETLWSQPLEPAARRELYARQVTTHGDCLPLDLLHARRNLHALYLATLEPLHSDLLDTFWDHDPLLSP